MIEWVEACPICHGDGWYAHGEFADETKTKIKIVRKPCPNGCPEKTEMELIQ